MTMDGKQPKHALSPEQVELIKQSVMAASRGALAAVKHAMLRQKAGVPVVQASRDLDVGMADAEDFLAELLIKALCDGLTKDEALAWGEAENERRNRTAPRATNAPGSNTLN